MGTAAATAGERSRAVLQARLPVALSGIGLVSMSAVSPAAVVGSWALIWRPMQQLCPQLFAGVDLDTAPQQVFEELRAARGRLMEETPPPGRDI